MLSARLRREPDDVTLILLFEEVVERLRQELERPPAADEDTLCTGCGPSAARVPAGDPDCVSASICHAASARNSG